MNKNKKQILKAIYWDIYKNTANITKSLSYFKDIIRILIDLSQKTSTDIQVMNQKWVNIKEKIEEINFFISDIKKNTEIIISQLDLKEKQQFIKKLNDKKNKWFFIFKNPAILIVIIIVIVGLILVLLGLIPAELFWKGLISKNY